MPTFILPDFPPRRSKKFWNNVIKGSPDQCWEWIGATDTKRYGKFFVFADGQYRLAAAHRVAFYLHTGVDPESLCVLHKCDNPPCCNPHHLWLGTNAENSADMASKGRGRKSHFCSDNDVYMMKELWGSGLYTQGEISSMYGISRGALCNALNSKTWRHVPDPIGYNPKHGWRFNSTAKTCS